MHLWTVRISALYLGLIGLNVYYAVAALPVASLFSWLLAHHVPWLVLFIVGLATVIVGVVMITKALASRRIVVTLLLMTLGVVIATSPFAGMMAQEAAK